MRSLVAGILVGWLIAAIWHNLSRPQPPPPKGAKTQRLHDTAELEEIRSKLGMTG